MLDLTTYRNDWVRRRKLYQDADKSGVRQDRIATVIRDMLNDKLSGVPRASLHHYSLALEQ